MKGRKGQKGSSVGAPGPAVLEDIRIIFSLTDRGRLALTKMCENRLFFPRTMDGLAATANTARKFYDFRAAFRGLRPQTPNAHPSNESRFTFRDTLAIVPFTFTRVKTRAGKLGPNKTCFLGFLNLKGNFRLLFVVKFITMRHILIVIFYARKQNASRVFAIVWASVCPSVCPSGHSSVTLVICIKTVQARITKSSLWAAQGL